MIFRIVTTNHSLVGHNISWEIIVRDDEVQRISDVSF